MRVGGLPRERNLAETSPKCPNKRKLIGTVDSSVRACCWHFCVRHSHRLGNCSRGPLRRRRVDFREFLPKAGRGVRRFGLHGVDDTELFSDAGRFPTSGTHQRRDQSGGYRRHDLSRVENHVGRDGRRTKRRLNLRTLDA
jgi:hypothetical protein